MGMTTDERYMNRCVQLARCGRNGSRPNPMVGAAIVASDGRIIGEGFHRKCGEAHAEVNAFASVREESLLPEATIYVSLEPCAHHGKTPPCADLIIKKGVRRVVIGCVDTFSAVQGRGIERLQKAGIEVTTGVLEAECRWLNRRFFTFHEQHRPYIILKWAQTANGLLDHDGRAVPISSPLTQMFVHRLRAQEDAIVVGNITNLREHPQLTVRHWSGRNPRRFVLSKDNPIGKILETCRQEQLQSLIVEGGRQALQAFIDAGLYDEVRVETATTLCIPSGTPAPALPSDLQRYQKKVFDNQVIERYIRQK